MNDPGFTHQLYSDVQLLEFKLNTLSNLMIPSPPPPLFLLGCATQKADLGARLPRFRS